MASSASGKSRIFYGWWLVAVCLLFQGVGVGTSIYLYSVFAGAIQESFVSTRFVLMSGASGLLIAMALLSPLVGRLIDRFPVRVILVGGALLMGVGFLLLSVATSIWQVVLCYTLFVGAGFTILSPLTASALLNRWFIRHRGTALGIAGLGTQLGGLLYPPVIATFIALYDWRSTAAGLGLFIIISVTILVWLSVTDYPGQKGLQPDGDDTCDPVSPTRVAATNISSDRVSLRYLYTQPTFLLLVLILGGVGSVCTAVISHVALFATDLGESRERGAYLISVLSFMGMISSPLIGRLCDTRDIRIAAGGVFLCSAAGLVLFLNADSYPLLLAGTALQGLAVGGHIPLWGSLFGQIYDSRILGQVLGASVLGMSTMTALMPSFAGVIYDLTDSYEALFLVMLVVMLIATLLLGLIRIPERPGEKLDGSRSSGG